MFGNSPFIMEINGAVGQESNRSEMWFGSHIGKELKSKTILSLFN